MTGVDAADPRGTGGGDPVRCAWAGGDALMVDYHDGEWGAPTTDDRELFELITLEGAQAGLSWRTVLHRREGYRRAFADFDPVAVAAFGPERQDALLTDPGIIRNRAKIASTLRNAAAFIDVAAEFGSFGTWLWAAVDGRPIVGRWTEADQLPAHTPLAQRLSAELRRRGFNFVGPTIVYSLLQSAGLVNHHITDCFRFAELVTDEAIVPAGPSVTGITTSEVRALALGLPEAVEADHHGMDSYRVRGKVFATVPDDTHVRIMVGEADIRAAVAGHPDVCTAHYWGQRLACVVVDLTRAPRPLVAEMLTEAWLRRAPVRLARLLTAGA